jgi:hypothetical protein
MFTDIYCRIHSQQFHVAMEREAKESLCYFCDRRWKILFLEGKDCLMVLQFSPNLCSYIQNTNSKYNKIFYTVFCVFSVTKSCYLSNLL